MDPRARATSLTTAALDRLMPLHLLLDATGAIRSIGPTLAKLMADRDLTGADVMTVFMVRRPAGIATAADLAARAGQRLHLTLRGGPSTVFRGLALPLADGQGLLLNLSFGIGVVDAVRQHALTDADFAPTDLTVEMLYLVEAKSAVMDELRSLNLRLQDGKSAAEEQALTDTLTGLRNRRALDIRLAALTAQARDFGLMHIDLDYFKAVNDTMGHAAGDHVLRAVAVVLQAETRSSDTVARVGGDEFVVVLPGLTDPQHLSLTARRIIDRLTQPIDFEGRPCRISASIGVTLSNFYDPPDPDRMQSDADHALYASKRAGRGQAQFHDPDRQSA